MFASSTSSRRTATRAAKVVTATALGSVLTMGTLTACGKAEVKEQAKASSSNLSDAKVASFVISLDDPDKNFAALADTAEDKKVAQFLTQATLKVTIDPPGDTTLGESSKAAGTEDTATALKKSGSFELEYANDGTSVFALRSIDGVMYVRLDPDQYQKLSGEPLPLDGLSQAEATLPGITKVGQGLKDGKWISLDLAAALGKADKSGLLKGATGGAGSSAVPDPATAQALGKQLVAAIEANATSKTTRDGDKTTIDVSVKAKSALTAILDVMAKPQFSSLTQLQALTGKDELADAKAEIAKLPDSSVSGTVLLTGDHLKRVTVDLGDLAALSQDDDAKALKTAKLVIDVDDSAPAIKAPANDDIVKVDALVDSALQTFGSAARGSLAG